MFYRSKVVCKCGSDNIQYAHEEFILVGTLDCQDCNHSWEPGPFERRFIQRLLRQPPKVKRLAAVSRVDEEDGS